MSAYQRYFSPKQVESDHKDIIISQLKAELFEMKKGQRDYDAVFERLRETEEHYYDLMKEIDMMREDFAKEEDEQIHEINVLRGELDNINAKNEDKRAHADKLNGDIAHLRAQLDDAEDEIRELEHSLRVQEGESERLTGELQDLQDQLRFLDEEQQKLLEQVADVEDQLAHENGRFRNNQARLNDLKRTKDNLKITLEKGLKDLDGIRKAIMDLKNACLEKESRISQLRKEVQRVEMDLQTAEDENQRLVDDLQRQKDLYNEQLAKNTALYDEINGLEKDLAALNIEIGKLNSELNYLDEKYARATALNGDLVAIIEELKIAIEELSEQSRIIIMELEQIVDQDEHVRGILDRKARIDQIRNMTVEKIKKYAYTRTLTVGHPKEVKRTTIVEKTITRSSVRA